MLPALPGHRCQGHTSPSSKTTLAGGFHGHQPPGKCPPGTRASTSARGTISKPAGVAPGCLTRLLPCCPFVTHQAQAAPEPFLFNFPALGTFHAEQPGPAGDTTAMRNQALEQAQGADPKHGGPGGVAARTGGKRSLFPAHTQGVAKCRICPGWAVPGGRAKGLAGAVIPI